MYVDHLRYADVLGTRSQRNNIGKDDKGEDNDSATTNTLDGPTRKQDSHGMCHGAQDGTGGEDQQRGKQAAWSTEDIA